VPVAEIDVDELERLLGAGAVLIDVREPAEFAEARVPGARLIPLGEVTTRFGEIDATADVLVICRSGARSYHAAEFLIEQGIAARNVAGGTQAWVDAGKPFDSDQGS
jgi:rhodanese-related sulfurtransferase